MRHAHNLSALGDKVFQLLEAQVSLFIYFPNFDFASLAPAEHLPGNYVGMVLALGDDDFITF